MRLVIVLCFVLAASSERVAVSAAPVSDFEKGSSGWLGPGGEGRIVEEPGQPGNHAYQIIATKAHHTRLTLAGSEAWPDFVASLRFKVLSFEGEPPTIYVYGRQTIGFRGLSVRTNQASGLCYYGQTTPSLQLGTVSVQAANRWVHAKLVCLGDRLAAKVWPEGAPEPRWQIDGAGEGQEQGKFALGVWTSPRTPSKARVLFDDITFQPIAEPDVASLGLRLARRKPLEMAAMGTKDGLFQTTDDAGLATASTIVAFDKLSGDLTHILHRASGQDFVSAERTQPLFSLTLTRPSAGEAMETTAADFRTVRMVPTAGGKLELEFSDHASMRLSSQVTAVAGADGLVRMGIRVMNQSGWAIARIEFPKFNAPAILGRDCGDDRLLAPFADGTVFESPGDYSQTREAVYPGHAFVQFMAFGDPAAGLYLATEDPNGHAKIFGLRTTKGRFVEMPLAHLVPEDGVEEVALPYEVALGTFVGDWRDAAALYKRWAQKQPWCAKTLVDRDDIPKFLKEGSGVIVVGIQNAKGYNGFLGDDLARLPELAAAYRQRTGLAHMIVVPYGWEGRGTWAGIRYFPAVPSNEAWQKANAALVAQGDRTALLTSGFWWVVKRRETHGGPAFDDTVDFEQRKEMVIQQADGKPWFVDNYDKVGIHGDWRGLSAKLCHGSQAARETMLNIFLDAVRLGTPLVSFDQEIGGGQNTPCYSPSHGHAPGWGNWMWTDFHDLCQEILRQGKSIRPELGLFMENTSELAIPYMATYWSRQFGEIDHGGFGARGVGLFSYLYHEYVTAIGAACVQGQGVQGTRPSAELRACVMANNLTRGLIPGPFIQDVPLEPQGAWEKTVSRAYFSFCQPYARFPEYLLLGVTCRPPQVRSAEQEAWFYRQDATGEPLKADGPRVRKATLTLPAVTAGSFTAEDGSIGTVLVNTTDQAQEATVTLVGTAKSALLYRADRTEERRYHEAPAEIRVRLEPFGTRMLVVR